MISNSSYLEEVQTFLGLRCASFKTIKALPRKCISQHSVLTTNNGGVRFIMVYYHIDFDKYTTRSNCVQGNMPLITIYHICVRPCLQDV